MLNAAYALAVSKLDGEDVDKFVDWLDGPFTAAEVADAARAEALVDPDNQVAVSVEEFPAEVRDFWAGYIADLSVGDVDADPGEPEGSAGD